MALLLMLLAFGWAASEYQDQVQWVEHTLQVEKQIGRLWSALLEAETGQRGYLLTGSQPLLDPYNAAVKAAPEEIDEFRELTRDNVEQQRSLSELRPLIEERMFLLRQRIEGYEKGNPDLANLPHGKEVLRMYCR